MKKVICFLISVLIFFIACSDENYISTERTNSIEEPPIEDPVVLPEGYEWQQYYSYWYSLDGCKFDGEVLTIDATILSDYKNSVNVMIFAGTWQDNIMNRIWIINCQTGYLWRFTPIGYGLVKTNFKKLWDADWQVETGITIKATIFPEIVENDLYYTVDDFTYKYNFLSGLIEVI